MQLFDQIRMLKLGIQHKDEKQTKILRKTIVLHRSTQLKGTVSLTFLLMHCIQLWPLITARWLTNLKSNFLSKKY